MKILIAPNCFKECADAITIAEAVREELESGLPDAAIEMLPVSDGGDGFLDVCSQAMDLEFRYVKVPIIYGEVLTDVRYGVDKSGKIVFIESAEVIGLARTPKEFRDPLNLSSLCLGLLLKAVMLHEPYVTKVVIGLGGTAINDMGLGCAGAFGLQMLDENGNQLPVLPANFEMAASLVLPVEEFPFQIELITDVQADLLGEWGTSRLFSPQKGASPDDVEKLEIGFCNILNILKRDFRLRYDDKKIGAAGGVALGISLFSKINLIPAKEFLFTYLGLLEKIKTADYVITAEGAYDSQSALQKAPEIILSEAGKMGKRGILIAGKSSLLGENSHFQIFTLIKHFGSLAESILNFRKGIKLVCREIINSIQKSS
jgi:glycerate 2-kinase